jgi:RNA-binding protein
MFAPAPSVENSRIRALACRPTLRYASKLFVRYMKRLAATGAAMPDLSQAQRQHLRRLAHHLKPLAQIGKHGVTEQALAAIDQQLAAQELIKVKFLDHQDERHALSQLIAERLNAALISVIGNVATFYRQQPDPDRRRIDLPAPSRRSPVAGESGER